MHAISDIISGFVGNSAVPKLQNNATFMKLVIVCCILFITLSEPLKVHLRKNIGRKALNLYGLLAGCLLYLTWGLMWAAAAIVTFISPFINYFASSNQYDPPTLKIGLFIPAILIGVYLAYSSKFWLKTFRKVLVAGMEEHFRAKAEDSQDWKVLEYRGDSVKFGYLLNEGWDKEQIWRIAEPVAVLKKALKTSLVLPLIGLPIVFTALSFWLNEWYHVHYKWFRMKESALEMKTETEKLNLLYNQTEISPTEFFVQQD